MEKAFSTGCEAAALSPAQVGKCPRCRAVGVPIGWVSGLCEACTDRRDLREDNGVTPPPRGEWVPEDYADTEVARLKGDPEAIARALEWRPTRRKSVAVLHGVSGMGKTRTAVLMAQGEELRVGGAVVVWWPGELGPCITAAWMDGEGGAARLMRESAEAGVLLLDDLDKSKITERTAEWLFAVIDARVRGGRTTIITTNATGEKLRARFDGDVGGPLLRRLKDYGTGFHLGEA